MRREMYGVVRTQHLNVPSCSVRQCLTKSKSSYAEVRKMCLPGHTLAPLQDSTARASFGLRHSPAGDLC